MIDTVRRVSRNVKRRQNGDMCPRWTTAGMLEAEQQFGKIIGYLDVAKLAAVECDIAARRAADIPTSTANTTVAPATPEVATTPA